jgi:very-short-patch-repair endonuclease
MDAAELGLVKVLRELRTDLARERRVAPYIIGPNATLEELATVRPSTVTSLLKIKGIGAKTASDFGAKFLETIAIYCDQHSLTRDNERNTSPKAEAADNADTVGGRARVPERSKETFEAISNWEIPADSVVDVETVIQLLRAIDAKLEYLRVRGRHSSWRITDEAPSLEVRIKRSRNVARRPGSILEEGVASALRAKGWTVHTQVQVVKYWIDLGVVHPTIPYRYLAGIECDGAEFHSDETSQKRDRIRQVAIEALGWKILRVRSSDWFDTPESVAIALHDELMHLLSEDE